MRAYLRTALFLSVIVGLVEVGCGSSDDGGSGGGGTGGTTTGGSASHGGSAGKGSGGSGATGGSSAGTTSGGGSAGSGTAGANDSAGADNSSAGADNSAAGAGEGGAPNVDPACNSVVQVAPTIQTTHTAAVTPAPTQGTIQPGTYYLTSFTYYEATGANIGVAATLVVTVNDKTATLNEVDSGGLANTIQIVMGTPATAAPASVTLICTTDPGNASAVGQEVALSYGATANTFTLILDGAKIAEVYTLHP